MSTEAAFHALEKAMERCTALQAEMTEKIPPEERGGRLMRAFELLDLMEHSLIEAAKSIREVKE